MTDLITRLESADGPDRELDADIYEVITNKCSHRHIMTVLGDGDGWGEVCSRCGEEEPYQVFKPYTASIDAALTLVPEGLAATVLLDAIDANQEAENWLRHLPRYIAIAALRAHQKDINV